MYSLSIMLMIFMLAAAVPLPIVPTTTPTLSTPVSAPTYEAALSPAIFLTSSGKGTMRGVQLRDNFKICPYTFPFSTFTIYCSLPAVRVASAATFKVNGEIVRKEYENPFFIGGDSTGMRHPWKIPQGPLTIECTGDNGVTVVVHGQFDCSGREYAPSSTPSPTRTPSPRRSRSLSPTRTPSPNRSSTPSPTRTPSLTKTPSTTQSTSRRTSPPSKSSSTIQSPAPTKSTSPLPQAESVAPTDPPSTLDAEEAHTRQESVKYRVSFEKVPDKFPMGVFEAGGSVLDCGDDNEKDLVVFGGFHGFPSITNAVYSRKYGNPTAPWSKLEDLPAPHATHMAQAVDGALICFVGGFVGAYPGVSGKRSFCYDNKKKTYIHLPDLPENRAGGGLVFVKNKENDVSETTLVYSGGTVRTADFTHTDYGTTWTLQLFKKGAQWIQTETMQAARNHMGAATTCGRHIFLGGQRTIDEKTGNSDVVSEYLPETRSWSKKPPAPLPIPLGHISASVLAYKCGLIVVGGITNGSELSDAVYYWDAASDTWTKIGTYPNGVSTPVCGIVGDTVMCATGGEWRDQSKVFYGTITAA